MTTPTPTDPCRDAPELSDDQIAAERKRFIATMKAKGVDAHLWFPNQPQCGFDNERVNDYWTGWLDRARALLAEPAPVGEVAPIDMILYCPNCGAQHVDKPDWHNDPQLGAIPLANGEQNADIAGNREAKQSGDEPVSVLLRQGSVAPGGHAEQPVQDVRLPGEAVHGDAQGVHEVQEELTGSGVLCGQPVRQPTALMQGVQSSDHGRGAAEESSEAQGYAAAASKDHAREASVQPHPGAVRGALGDMRTTVRDLRQAGAASEASGQAVSRSLPQDGADSRRTVLPVQHDAGVRQRRLDVAAQRDQVPSEASLKAPSHRSHLCRPEDGGCGCIWRPADVATNGVRTIATKGKADTWPANATLAGSATLPASGDADGTMGGDAPFQQRVQPWMTACFGPVISSDKVERNHRFLEEALELVQATGCTANEAHQLVDYTFGRPVGDASQEVGGVMVTLAALCLAQGFDMHAAGETELARIWTMVDKIRAKQAAKPKHSPLPEATPASPDTGAAVEKALQKALEALEVASNGLAWYRDSFPEAVDGSDDEADEIISDALAHIRSIAPQPKDQP